MEGSRKNKRRLNKISAFIMSALLGASPLLSGLPVMTASAEENTIKTGYSVEYNRAEQKPDVAVLPYSGATVKLPTGAYTVAYTTGDNYMNVGTHKLTINPVVNANYTFDPITVEYEITKKPISIEYKSDGASGAGVYYNNGATELDDGEYNISFSANYNADENPHQLSAGTAERPASIIMNIAPANNCNYDFNAISVPFASGGITSVDSIELASDFISSTDQSLIHAKKIYTVDYTAVFKDDMASVVRSEDGWDAYIEATAYIGEAQYTALVDKITDAVKQAAQSGTTDISTKGQGTLQIPLEWTANSRLGLRVIVTRSNGLIYATESILTEDFTPVPTSGKISTTDSNVAQNIKWSYIKREGSDNEIEYFWTEDANLQEVVTDNKLIIPAKFKGLDVKGIGSPAPEGKGVIPTENNKYAFNEIVIPNSVDTIHTNCFNGLQGNNIAQVIIPETVSKIEKAAFANSDIQKVEIKGATTIDEYAFLGCDKLKSVKVTTPQSGTAINKQAISSCSNLEEITVNGTGSLTVGEFGFSGNEKLKQLWVALSGGSSVELGVKAVSESTTNPVKTGITVALKGSTIIIGENAFENKQFEKNPTIKATNMSSTPVSIGSMAFKNTTANGNSLELIIPSGAAFGEDAFLDSSMLSKLVIYGNAEIGRRAFKDNTTLTDVVFGSKGANKIGQSAFSGTSIKDIFIPEGTSFENEDNQFGNIKTLNRVETTSDIPDRVFENSNVNELSVNKKSNGSNITISACWNKGGSSDTGERSIYVEDQPTAIFEVTNEYSSFCSGSTARDTVVYGSLLDSGENVEVTEYPETGKIVYAGRIGEWNKEINKTGTTSAEQNRKISLATAGSHSVIFSGTDYRPDDTPSVKAAEAVQQETTAPEQTLENIELTPDEKAALEALEAAQQAGESGEGEQPEDESKKKQLAILKTRGMVALMTSDAFTAINGFTEEGLTGEETVKAILNKLNTALAEVAMHETPLLEYTHEGSTSSVTVSYDEQAAIIEQARDSIYNKEIQKLKELGEAEKAAATANDADTAPKVTEDRTGETITGVKATFLSAVNLTNSRPMVVITPADFAVNLIYNGYEVSTTQLLSNQYTIERKGGRSAYELEQGIKGKVAFTNADFVGEETSADIPVIVRYLPSDAVSTDEVVIHIERESKQSSGGADSAGDTSLQDIMDKLDSIATNNASSSQLEDQILKLAESVKSLQDAQDRLNNIMYGSWVNDGFVSHERTKNSDGTQKAKVYINNIGYDVINYGSPEYYRIPAAHETLGLLGTFNLYTADAGDGRTFRFYITNKGNSSDPALVVYDINGEGLDIHSVKEQDGYVANEGETVFTNDTEARNTVNNEVYLVAEDSVGVYTDTIEDAISSVQKDIANLNSSLSEAIEELGSTQSEILAAAEAIKEQQEAAQAAASGQSDESQSEVFQTIAQILNTYNNAVNRANSKTDYINANNEAQEQLTALYTTVKTPLLVDNPDLTDDEAETQNVTLRSIKTAMRTIDESNTILTKSATNQQAAQDTGNAIIDILNKDNVTAQDLQMAESLLNNLTPEQQALISQEALTRITEAREEVQTQAIEAAKAEAATTATEAAKAAADAEWQTKFDEQQATTAEEVQKAVDEATKAAEAKTEEAVNKAVEEQKASAAASNQQAVDKAVADQKAADEAAVKKAEETAEAAKKQQETAEADLKKAKEQQEAAEKDLKDAQSDLKDVQDKYDKKIEGLESDLKTAQTTAQQTATENANAIKELQSKNAELATALEQAKTNGGSVDAQRLNSLQAQVTEAQQKQQSAEAEAKSAQDKVSSLQSEIENLRTQRASATVSPYTNTGGYTPIGASDVVVATPSDGGSAKAKVETEEKTSAETENKTSAATSENAPTSATSSEEEEDPAKVQEMLAKIGRTEDESSTSNSDDENSLLLNSDGMVAGTKKNNAIPILAALGAAVGAAGIFIFLMAKGKLPFGKLAKAGANGGQVDEFDDEYEGNESEYEEMEGEESGGSQDSESEDSEGEYDEETESEGESENESEGDDNEDDGDEDEDDDSDDEDEDKEQEEDYENPMG